MIRWLLWMVGGAVLGGIVHLATVLVLPRTATQDAYARLAAISPVNAFVAAARPVRRARAACRSWIRLLRRPCAATTCRTAR